MDKAIKTQVLPTISTADKSGKARPATTPRGDTTESERLERELDEALEETFPASDPAAIS